jgi:hypothetical protein
MVSIRSKIILFFLLICPAAAAVTEKSMIEVNSSVDSSLITIGDLITYTITIDYADSLAIEKPGEGVHLGQFEIKDYKIDEPVYKNQRIFQKYEFVISVYDTGRFVIPPFPIAFFPKDSISKYQIIEASAIPIYVKSVIQDEEKQLRDIKNPLEIPFNYLFVVSVAAVIVLLAVIAYLGYKFYKKRKEKGYLIKPPEPVRPAHEIALESIERLLEEQLIEKKEIKLFYSRLSEIIRRYIEDCFYISALEETSMEIIEELQLQNMAEETVDLLREFFTLADFVKFAKYLPTDDENAQSIEMAKQFITSTMVVVPETIEERDKEDLIESKQEVINQNN